MFALFFLFRKSFGGAAFRPMRLSSARRARKLTTNAVQNYRDPKAPPILMSILNLISGKQNSRHTCNAAKRFIFLLAALA
jgi:hypothetical protein